MADDPNPNPNPAAEPWYKGIEGADLGVIQTRNWDKLAPAEAARAAFTELQKLASEITRVQNIPASEIVRFPKDANDPGWADVHKRLGWPEDKAAYDFANVKFSDGSAVADDFAATMRDAFHAARLTPAQAEAATTAFVKFLDDAEKAAATQAGFTKAAEDEKLKVNWGANYETNMFVAKRAASVLGISDEAFNAVASNLGMDGATAMETLRKLGVAMGEARFITGENPANRGIMSADQAAARMEEIKADGAWQRRYLAGGADEKRELEQLQTLIVRARMTQGTGAAR